MERAKRGLGIGSHTDYWLLVTHGEDDVGGLRIWPRGEGKHIKN
jgi:isopenicillin N synthase-like dioxygenase